MSGITSSVGLVSGINTADLIDQLLAVEARPKTLIQRNSALLNSQQVAFQEINAKLLSFKVAADELAKTATFNAKSATSSNTSVLTASASTSAVPGSYDFTVSRLLSTQQMISGGFEDKDATAVGAGELSFEFGPSKLSDDTQLNRLNASEGISRGKIRITDRSGATATIDLSKALTVNEVLETINNAAGVDVTASIDGDKFVITDNTGQTASNLVIANSGSTGTATSLGIEGSVAATSLSGSVINTVGSDTLLGQVNDGLGVRILTSQNDFSITTQDGASFNVNLEGSKDLGDVVDKINTAGGGSITAAINASGNALELTDNTTGATTFAVTALNSSGAAYDLGILTSDLDRDGTIAGDRLVANLNSKLLRNLGGGAGVGYVQQLGDRVLRTTTPLSELFDGAGLDTSGDGVDDIQIFARDTWGTSYTIDVDASATVGDLITAFDTETGGKVTLSIEDNALRVTDNTGSTAQNLRLQDFTSHNVTGELGIEINLATSTHLGNDLNPVRDVLGGYGPGEIEITNRAGTTTAIDMTSARSVSDVLSLINAAGAGVTASLDGTGTGIKLTDTSGGAGDLIIADTNGSLATTLGLAGTHSGTTTAESGNLQLRYVSTATRLEQLNGGSGVSSGKFTITDSNGQTATVDLTQGNEVTVADVIGEINSRGLAITARVNDNGDGILIEDTGTGAVAIKVEEAGSTTAADLGLLGEAENPGDDFNGSFEKTIEIDADDTLQDLADKINDAGLGVAATIINDGSGINPFRLSLTATDSGKAGEFVFDSGDLDIGMTQLVEAKNAVVFYGSSDPASAIAITSASNSLDSAIPGATINLVSTSDAPVRVTVARNTASVGEKVQSFVTRFNDVITTLNKYDKYDEETESRGILLGDTTVSQIRSIIYRRVIGADGDLSGQYTALSQIGVRITSGAKLSFDSAKLTTAMSNDFDAVKQLFSLRETETDEDTGELSLTAGGIGVDIAELLGSLTDSSNGLVQRRLTTLQNRVDFNKDRIEQFDLKIEAKRLRLQAQFNAMETTLAQLQRQSSALAGFQPVSVGGGGGNVSNLLG